MGEDIFAKKPDKDEQLAGAYIPRQLSEQLTLLALYHNTTKSDLLRGLITSHIESEAKIQDMIVRISQRILESWRTYRKMKGHGKITFNEYKDEVRKTLEIRKIANAHIEMIMIKTKELHNANKAAKTQQSSATRRSERHTASA